MLFPERNILTSFAATKLKLQFDQSQKSGWTAFVERFVGPDAIPDSWYGAKWFHMSPVQRALNALAGLVHI
jgi:hypothetical protein